MTIEDTKNKVEPKPDKKRRSPPSQFAGQVEEVGDVTSLCFISGLEYVIHSLEFKAT